MFLLFFAFTCALAQLNIKTINIEEIADCAATLIDRHNHSDSRIILQTGVIEYLVDPKIPKDQIQVWVHAADQTMADDAAKLMSSHLENNQLRVSSDYKATEFEKICCGDARVRGCACDADLQCLLGACRDGFCVHDVTVDPVDDKSLVCVPGALGCTCVGQDGCTQGLTCAPDIGCVFGEPNLEASSAMGLSLFVLGLTLFEQVVAQSENCLPMRQCLAAATGAPRIVVHGSNADLEWVAASTNRISVLSFGDDVTLGDALIARGSETVYAAAPPLDWTCPFSEQCVVRRRTQRYDSPSVAKDNLALGVDFLGSEAQGWMRAEMAAGQLQVAAGNYVAEYVFQSDASVLVGVIVDGSKPVIATGRARGTADEFWIDPQAPELEVAIVRTRFNPADSTHRISMSFKVSGGGGEPKGVRLMFGPGREGPASVDLLGVALARVDDRSVHGEVDVFLHRRLLSSTGFVAEPIGTPNSMRSALFKLQSDETLLYKAPADLSSAATLKDVVSNENFLLFLVQFQDGILVDNGGSNGGGDNNVPSKDLPVCGDNTRCPTSSADKLCVRRAVEAYDNGGQLSPATRDDYDNWVKLPRQPAVSSFAETRQNCPHDSAGLVSFGAPSTWPDSRVPTDGNVVIPSGKRVVLKACDVVGKEFVKITVPSGSALIFADEAMVLRTQAIVVRGELLIGSETCRVRSLIDIELLGAANNDDNLLDGFGRKGIYVAPSGTLDIHAHRFLTWTRLRASAKAGDRRIHLQREVDWLPGQEILVVTTIMQDLFVNENERMQIVAVSPDRMSVQLSEPLKFAHYGGAEYQAEVGLLTRRVTLRGDSGSVDSGFGGHVLVQGVARIAGVQLQNMGQTNRLGRYPLHMHLAGDGSASYFVENSCDETLFRCIVIHGTDNVRVERNVAYRTTGHSIYVEDGVEMQNVFEHNLVVSPRAIAPLVAYGNHISGEKLETNAQRVNPSDATPACFYISNAGQKSITGNSAVGGFSGFWFPVLTEALGAFYQQSSVVPSDQPLVDTVFRRNCVHSQGGAWASQPGVYIGGQISCKDNTACRELVYRSGRGELLPNRQDMVGSIKAFLSYTGLLHWGARSRSSDLETIDCAQAAFVMRRASLANSFINARSQNPHTGTGRLHVPDYYDVPVRPLAQTFRGVVGYDTQSMILFTNVTFHNFCDSLLTDEAAGISAEGHLDTETPSGIMTAAGSVQWTGCHTVNKRFYMSDPQRDVGGFLLFNLYDSFGQISGTNEPTLIGSSSPWWRATSRCVQRGDWEREGRPGMWVCPLGSPPQYTAASLLLTVPDVTARGMVSQKNNPVGKTCLFGDADRASLGTRCVRMTENERVTGPSNRGWFWSLQKGSPRKFRIRVERLLPQEYVVLAVSYPRGANVVHVRGEYIYGPGKYNGDFRSVDNVAQLRAAPQNDKVYHMSGNGMLYIRIIATEEIPRTQTTIFANDLELEDFLFGTYINVQVNCAVVDRQGQTEFCRADSVNAPNEQV